MTDEEKSAKLVVKSSGEVHERPISYSTVLAMATILIDEGDADFGIPEETKSFIGSCEVIHG